MDSSFYEMIYNFMQKDLSYLCGVKFVKLKQMKNFALFAGMLEENDPNENITNPDENTKNSGQDKDKYELEHIDPNILRDPILLIKYLNDSEKKRNNKE